MVKQIGFSVIVLCAVAAVLAGVAIAAPNMREGTWEIKGEMKLEGMPFPMPAMPVNFTKCLTKKDMVPQQKDKNQECITESTKVDGNTVSWVMKCKDKKGNLTDGTGKVTYKGSSFEGKIHNVTTDPKGAKSESTLTMNGKRTGDCK